MWRNVCGQYLWSDVGIKPPCFWVALGDVFFCSSSLIPWNHIPVSLLRWSLRACHVRFACVPNVMTLSVLSHQKTWRASNIDATSKTPVKCILTAKISLTHYWHKLNSRCYYFGSGVNIRCRHVFWWDSTASIGYTSKSSHGKLSDFT